ncbi:MAG TPA: respiratory nitrate reductase subunit gamma [Candidatus Angelobacter sp.]|nr:respiratory nitrate reductase subunit gamma [Candidatus Angelobacter sp.]
MKPSFAFTSWPYVAFALLVGIVFLRYLFMRGKIDQIDARISKAWEIFGGGIFWRFSVFLLVAAHLVGFIFAEKIAVLNSNIGALYLIEGVGFGLGVIALLSGLRLVWKQLGQTSGSFMGEAMDTMLLAVLLVGVVSGLLMAAIYRWGSSWGVAILVPYIFTILRGKPNSVFVAEMPFLVQLHVFSFFVALAVLPFTRLGPVLVLAFHRCVNLVGKPVLAGANVMEGWLRRHNPGAWIWPEED